MDTGSPTKTGVPQIVLLDEKGKEHHGVQGSYCWDGAAIDYDHPSRRTDIREKLVVQRGASTAFTLVGHTKPEKFQVTIFSGNKMISTTTVNRELKLELPKGTYFVGVSTGWKGNDVSNIFLVEVL